MLIVENSKCLKVLKSKTFVRLFFAVLISFLLASGLNIWHTTKSVSAKIQEDKINYQAIVTNANLLNKCFVATPNFDYCFAVLKTFNGQILDADFSTKKLQLIRTIAYSYLVSLSLPIENQNILIRVATNNELIIESFESFLPLNLANVLRYRNILKAKYIFLIDSENSQYIQKSNAIIKEETKKLIEEKIGN